MNEELVVNEISARRAMRETGLATELLRRAHRPVTLRSATRKKADGPPNQTKGAGSS